MSYRFLATEEAIDVRETARELAENPGLIREQLEKALPWLLNFLVQLIIAVIILLVGLRVIKFIVNTLKKSLKKGKIEEGVISFLCSLLKYVLYFVLFMMILAQFGVTTGSVVAVLGSAGLTVGLALQGSLANFAGGVLILLLKPFVVGDYIVDNGSGKEGTVVGISIFYTKLNSIDNKVILIPNGSLSNSTITNVSGMDTRRLDILVGVSYDSDIAKVKEVLNQLALEDEGYLSDRPLDVFVDSLGDSSIQMGLRFWVKNSEYFTVKWRITEKIKYAFDENGISIPFPQLDVQISTKQP